MAIVDTIQRIKSMTVRAKEIMEIFNCSQETAWAMLGSSEAQRALEVVERIETRQRKIAQAEMRSLSARAATLKANIENDLEK